VAKEIFSGERPYAFQMPADAAICVVNFVLRPSQKRIRSQNFNLLADAWNGDGNTIFTQLKVA